MRGSPPALLHSGELASALTAAAGAGSLSAVLNLSRACRLPNNEGAKKPSSPVTQAKELGKRLQYKKMPGKKIINPAIIIERLISFCSN